LLVALILMVRLRTTYEDVLLGVEMLEAVDRPRLDV
jgi:hypothetical protein